MVPLLTIDWDTVEERAPAILAIIGILLVGYVIFRAVFPRIARAAILRNATTPDSEMDQRADTIVHVVERTAGGAALVIGAITVLNELGVDITAIVTGLGITGLALALGAQALVRDGINGIFLLAEDQYRTGDVVRIADVIGTVESISLRRTIIRDEDGVVHSVPNGAINVVSNYTRDFARVNVRVAVAVGQDLSKVDSVIDRVGREMMEDPRFGDLISEPPSAGIVEVVEGAVVTLLVSVRAKPASRQEVASELRRRLLEAFMKEKIRVPGGES